MKSECSLGANGEKIPFGVRNSVASSGGGFVSFISTNRRRVKMRLKNWGYTIASELIFHAAPNTGCCFILEYCINFLPLELMLFLLVVLIAHSTNLEYNSEMKVNAADASFLI